MTDDTPFPVTSHAPDDPFGCPRMWGEPVRFADMGTHVCNRPEGHTGEHQCKCWGNP